MNRLFSPTKVYSLSEAAALLRVSRVTLLHAVHRRALKGYRVGKQWRVMGRDILDYLEARTQSPANLLE